MGMIVILSEEGNIFFSFDERCLYINNLPHPEILSGLPFDIYEYLAHNAPAFKSCEEIYQSVWVEKNGKEKPVNDSSIRGHVKTIREYLGDHTSGRSGSFKYIDVSSGRYRSLQKAVDQKSVEHTAPERDTLAAAEKSSKEDVQAMHKSAYFINRYTGRDLDMALIEEVEAIIHSLILQVKKEMWESYSLSQKIKMILNEYEEVTRLEAELGVNIRN